jgi:hypothetical protein
MPLRVAGGRVVEVAAALLELRRVRVRAAGQTSTLAAHAFRYDATGTEARGNENKRKAGRNCDDVGQAKSGNIGGQQKSWVSSGQARPSALLLQTFW